MHAITTILVDLPSVTVSDTSYHILKNQNVTLSCTVPTVSPPVLNVSWSLRSSGSSSGAILDIAGNADHYSGGTLATPSLTIIELQDADEGHYTCSATNLVGMGNSTEIFLNVSGSKYMCTWVVLYYYFLRFWYGIYLCRVCNKIYIYAFGINKYVGI